MFPTKSPTIAPTKSPTSVGYTYAPTKVTCHLELAVSKVRTFAYLDTHKIKLVHKRTVLRLQRVRVRGRGLRGGGDGRVALACWRACSAPRVRRQCAGGSRARARRHGARLGLLWSGGRGFEDGGGEGGALRLQRVRVRGRGLRGGGRWYWLRLYVAWY